MAKKTIDKWIAELSTLLKKGDAHKLLSRANICIKAYPNEAAGYHYRGVANADLEKFEEAVEDCNKALELNPNNVGAYNNRGSAK